MISLAIHTIRTHLPDTPQLVTTNTESGLNRVRQIFSSSVWAQLAPLDFLPVIALFIIRNRPQALFIAETELWPNMIQLCRWFRIPIAIINARISDRTFHRYYKTRFFWSPLLKAPQLILARTSLDRNRFIALGAKPENVIIVPNIKTAAIYSLIHRQSVPEELDQWRSDQPMVVFGSIHDKEEPIILNVINQLSEALPELRIIIAPRHLNRLNPWSEKLNRLKIGWALRSQIETAQDKRVLLIDSMGELLKFYSRASLAFVGGTLSDFGGHNILEPVLCQVPVLFGPYTQNCKADVEWCLKQQIGIQIKNEIELTESMFSLLTQGEAYQTIYHRIANQLRALDELPNQLWSQISISNFLKIKTRLQ